MLQSTVVISFQFSTFVSLMQHSAYEDYLKTVVISFQFSTFVSLMQPYLRLYLLTYSCD